MSAETPPLISREEAARLLGTSVRHLRRLIQQGHLTLETDASGTRGLRLETIDELASKRRRAITQLEAAARLGCDRRTIRRMLDDGRLEAVPTPGGRAQVALASVEARQADTMGQAAIMGHKADRMGHPGSVVDKVGHPVSHPVLRDAELVPLLDAGWPNVSDPVEQQQPKAPSRIAKRRLVRAAAGAATLTLGLLAATFGPGLIASQRASVLPNAPPLRIGHRTPLAPITPLLTGGKQSVPELAGKSPAAVGRPRARGGIAVLVSHRVRTPLRHAEAPRSTARSVATIDTQTSGARASVSRTGATTRPVGASVCSDVYGPEGLC